MTQSQGPEFGSSQHYNSASGDGTVIDYTGTGDQTVTINTPTQSLPRFRRGFGWALLVFLALDVVFAVVMWATGGQYAGLWQLMPVLLFVLTVLTALLWLRLTRRVFGGLLRAVLGLFTRMDRATNALTRFLGGK